MRLKTELGRALIRSGERGEAASLIEQAVKDGFEPALVYRGLFFESGWAATSAGLQLATVASASERNSVRLRRCRVYAHAPRKPTQLAFIESRNLRGLTSEAFAARTQMDQTQNRLWL